MSSVSSAGQSLDPVEAVKDNVDRSRRLIAETLEDLSQHHSWLETYHREERRRAERLRRQEALERLELRRQRAAFVSRRFAVRAYRFIRAAIATLTAICVTVIRTAGTFLRWAAPRADRLTRETLARLAHAVSSAAAWLFDGTRLLSGWCTAALAAGFLWSVRASEKAGIVFRRKLWRFAYVPAARLGREAVHVTAPARRRAGVFWRRTWMRTWKRTWIKTQAQAAGLKDRLAATWTGTAFHAGAARRARRAGVRVRIAARALTQQLGKGLGNAATSIDAARKRLAAASGVGWARMRIVQRALAARLETHAARAADAIKSGWGKCARTASLQFARTRRTAAALERRAAERVIHTGPRIGRFLAQHTPERTSKKSQALIVRPNTALVHADPGFAPSPPSA